MVNFCSVYNCSNRSNRDKVSFHSIPKIIDHRDQRTLELSSKRRTAWLAQIKGKDFKPSKYTRICSKHFIRGKPSDLYDHTNPDWVPSLHVGCSEEESPRVDHVSRYERGKARQKKKETLSVAQALLELSIPEASVNEEDITELPNTDVEQDETNHSSDDESIESDISITEKMRVEMQHMLTENLKLRKDIQDYQLSEESFKHDNERVKFYTGLPSFLVLSALFNFISPYLSIHGRSALTKLQQVILVLMRLRLNLSIQDLAYRFNISKTTVSRTFKSVIAKMSDRMECLIVWPERDQLRLTMPMIFRRHFGLKVAAIIDCFEVFCEKPSGFTPRCQTWSSYKHHNTIKFLISVTPQGTVSFISRAWGGRTSDKTISEHCGFLKNLLPGDLVLADHGFDIASSVGLMCAEVKIPAFTKGKKQLSPREIETTRKIANVRIHVERVIGLVRNKYTLLQGIIPLDYLKTESNENALINQIMTVCCALINMCDSIVPFD